MTNATAYIPSEVIDTTTNNRVYDSTDFETNNLDYVKVEIVRGNTKILLVKETDYTIAALDLGYKFRVRITLTNAPQAGDTLKFSMNAPLAAPVDFVSPDVKRVDFDNMQRSVESAASQSATVEAKNREFLEDNNQNVLDAAIVLMDDKDASVLLKANGYTNDEIAKVNKKLEAFGTGFVTDSYDPETGIITITFTNGDVVELNVPEILSVELDAVKARITALENADDSDTVKLLDKFAVKKTYTAKIDLRLEE